MDAGKSIDVNFEEFDFDSVTTIKNFIDKGAFGDVFGPFTWNSKNCAVKRIMICQSGSGCDLKAKDIWASLKHENLIEIHKVVSRPKVLYFVLEYASGGSLRNLLDKPEVTYCRKIPNWAKQIAEGMRYLHERDIVHRDLKSNNIMLMEPFDSVNADKEITLKVADFDEVKEHYHTTTMSLTGTYAYTAPEVLKTQKFSKSSDVWSYGVVVWEMLTRERPHQGIDNIAMIVKALSDQLMLHIPESLPEALKELLQGCLHNDKDCRLSFCHIVVRLLSIQEMATGGAPEMQGIGPDDAAQPSQEVYPDPAIFGLTVLFDEVFLSYQRSSVIDVYDSTTFKSNRQLEVNGLTDPEHIVSCNVNRCLYSFDWSYRGKTNKILRIDPLTGKIMKNWNTTGGGGRMSVAADTNIILNMNFQHHLTEYTADGELLRIINLSSGTGIVQAWHATKLASGMFLVAHGGNVDPKSRVCLMSIIENDRLRQKYFDAEVVTTFGDDLGDPVNRLQCPIYLAVDKEGSILVCDGSKRLLKLNSCLQKPRQLSPVEPEAVSPWRVCVDESNGQYLMADFYTVFACKERSDGKIDWQVVLDKRANAT